MEQGRSTSDHLRIRSVVTEFAVVATVFFAYRWGRLLTRNANGEALRNARHVIDFEQVLGIFSERTVQGWALGSNWLIDVLNRYYVTVHFPITVAFLVWAYFRHNSAYRFIRTWFVMVTLSALVIHVGFPLAPPRMTNGFVDTLQRFGPRIYSRDPRRSVANQFAAMPSLHFGWALMLATSFVAIKRTRRSAIIMLHPAITLFAIVATGNHYWLDAIVAGLLAAAFATVLLSLRVVRTGQLAPVARPAFVEVPQSSVSPWPFDATDDDRQFSMLSARRHERCRQHNTVGHERIDADEYSATATTRAEHPPG
ncbi:MAG: putative rane protein [Ilumatobacteraceae bacterium]|nr:putative rane protein [Ilumatobacteraceae bacterium]